MIVYLVTALVALFYLFALPLKLGVVLKTEKKPHFQIGYLLGGFGKSYDGGLRYAQDTGATLTLARRDAPGKSKTLSLTKKAGMAAALMPSAMRGISYLIGNIRIQMIRANFVIATGDAAKTALLYGAASSLYETLRSVRPDLRLRARIQADFSGNKSNISFYGILYCQLGHIILAVLLSAMDFIKRRFQSWTNIRSKVS